MGVQNKKMAERGESLGRSRGEQEGFKHSESRTEFHRKRCCGQSIGGMEVRREEQRVRKRGGGTGRGRGREREREDGASVKRREGADEASESFRAQMDLAGTPLAVWRESGEQ
eukprot:4736687-Pleurochrysis_carterae.AAC.2